MKNQLLMVILLGLGLSFSLSACRNAPKNMPDDVISEEYEGRKGDPSLETTPTKTTSTTGLEGEGGLVVVSLDEVIATSGNVIYFDYNSAEIRDESIPLIMAAAESLVANPAAQLRLEGHADERGTREFNLALGEKRAKTVHDLIVLQGVSRNQLDVVSYGEERPVDAGSDETSWQQNRRVELIR